MHFAATASVLLAVHAVASSVPFKARTECAGSIGCIAGAQYCSYKGKLTNLHSSCAEDRSSSSDDWKRDSTDEVKRNDCAGSVGCIAGSQYCSYNGELTNLNTPCTENWGSWGSEWKRADCAGSIGCIAGKACKYKTYSISISPACIGVSGCILFRFSLYALTTP